MKLNLTEGQVKELRILVFWEAFTGNRKVEDVRVFSKYYNYLMDLPVYSVNSVRVSKEMTQRLEISLEDVIQYRMVDPLWVNSNVWNLRELHFTLATALEKRSWHIHYEALDARNIKLNQTIRIGWMVGKVVLKTSKCVVIVGKWETRS